MRMAQRLQAMGRAHYRNHQQPRLRPEIGIAEQIEELLVQRAHKTRVGRLRRRLFQHEPLPESLRAQIQPGWPPLRDQGTVLLEPSMAAANMPESALWSTWICVTHASRCSGSTRKGVFAVISPQNPGRYRSQESGDISRVVGIQGREAGHGRREAGCSSHRRQGQFVSSGFVAFVAFAAAASRVSPKT